MNATAGRSRGWSGRPLGDGAEAQAARVDARVCGAADINNLKANVLALSIIVRGYEQHVRALRLLLQQPFEVFKLLLDVVMQRRREQRHRRTRVPATRIKNE